jgi:Cof subfamily protein (haloacid dehalogenase superfamily)
VVRLIALDLDGTLLRADGHVGERTAAHLVALHRQGVAVVIATGRSWRTALRIQQELGIAGPAVAHNGAYAFDSRSGAEWYARRVPRQAARTMLAWATAHDIMVRCYLGVGQPVLFNFFTEEHVARFRRPEDAVAGDLSRTLDTDPLELFVVGNREVDSFVDRFGRLGPGYELVTFERNGRRELNICAPGVDKVEGVAAVARRLGIPPSDILAVGDGPNDVRLLRWSGLAVAVGGGHDQAAAVADYVTPPDSPEPVADALEWALSRPWAGAPPAAEGPA